MDVRANSMVLIKIPYEQVAFLKRLFADHFSNKPYNIDNLLACTGCCISVEEDPLPVTFDAAKDIADHLFVPCFSVHDNSSCGGGEKSNAAKLKPVLSQIFLSA